MDPGQIHARGTRRHVRSDMCPKVQRVSSLAVNIHCRPLQPSFFGGRRGSRHAQRASSFLVSCTYSFLSISLVSGGLSRSRNVWNVIARTKVAFAENWCS